MYKLGYAVIRFFFCTGHVSSWWMSLLFFTLRTVVLEMVVFFSWGLGRVRPWIQFNWFKFPGDSTLHLPLKLEKWQKTVDCAFFHQFTVYYWILGSKSSISLSPMIMGQWKMALHRLKGSNSILRIFWDTPMFHWIMIMGGRVSN